MNYASTITAEAQDDIPAEVAARHGHARTSSLTRNLLIFGGGLSLVLGQTELVLILVIAAKIFVDLKSHVKEHST